MDIKDRAERLLHMALAAAIQSQPQVIKALKPLLIGYTNGGELQLDLYGTLEDDGYNVQDACLIGTTASLSELLSVEQLKDFSAYCDRHLPTLSEVLASGREDYRAFYMEKK